MSMLTTARIRARSAAGSSATYRRLPNSPSSSPPKRISRRSSAAGWSASARASASTPALPEALSSAPGAGSAGPPEVDRVEVRGDEHDASRRRAAARPVGDHVAAAAAAARHGLGRDRVAGLLQPAGDPGRRLVEPGALAAAGGVRGQRRQVGEDRVAGEGVEQREHGGVGFGRAGPERDDVVDRDGTGHRRAGPAAPPCRWVGTVVGMAGLRGSAGLPGMGPAQAQEFARPPR